LPAAGSEYYIEIDKIMKILGFISPVSLEQQKKYRCQIEEFRPNFGQDLGLLKTSVSVSVSGSRRALLVILTFGSAYVSGKYDNQTSEEHIQDGDHHPSGAFCFYACVWANCHHGQCFDHIHNLPHAEIERNDHGRVAA
jgi:hypothetical protein